MTYAGIKQKATEAARMKQVDPLSESQQMVQSIHDESVGPRHSQTLDPIPNTDAG